MRRGCASPSSMEASHKKHRPHIKVGKDAEEEVTCFVDNTCSVHGS